MYHLALLVLGLLALAAVLLPLWTRDRIISFPLVLLIAGGALAWLFPEGLFDPIAQGAPAERLAEFAVIIALTGLGLSIDRRVGWRSWSVTWRLLAVTMPLSIAASAWLGWWIVGVAPAAALLFGASLAPTDPVLAVDVQTGPPTTGDPDADESDEVRFALTSESSLNDGLAFPFTNLAVLVAAFGWAPREWLTEWLLIDVAYKIVGGLLIGWLVGWLCGRLTLRLVGSRGSEGLLRGGEDIATAVLVLAYTLVSYGVAELLGTYGFIAVFVTAYVVRDTERTNDVHDHLHQGAEQLELFAMSVIMVLVGAALADGLWREITVPVVVLALLLVLVVRPIAGWVGLAGDTRLRRPERLVVAAFGIKGLGSIYYLAYGINRADLGTDATTLWAMTLTTIVVSLVVHGLAARPVMRWLDARRATDRATVEEAAG